MKKIIFIRHAKSSWNHDVGDMHRPLKKRGRLDSGLVSNAFESLGLNPDIIFSSPAKRALETCKIFMEKLKVNVDKLKIEQQLYDFGGNSVVQFIKYMDNLYNCVMIFGHNHAFTSIVNTYGNIYIDNLPTCGLVVIEFDIINWKDFKPGQTLTKIFPKDLKE